MVHVPRNSLLSRCRSGHWMGLVPNAIHFPSGAMGRRSMHIQFRAAIARLAWRAWARPLATRPSAGREPALLGALGEIGSILGLGLAPLSRRHLLGRCFIRLQPRAGARPFVPALRVVLSDMLCPLPLACPIPWASHCFRSTGEQHGRSSVHSWPSRFGPNQSR